MYQSVDYHHDFTTLLDPEYESMCDFLLISKQKEAVGCHRSILSTLSKTFRNMWTDNEPFANPQSRYSMNRSTYILKQFVHALYGKPGTWSVDDALILMEMAEEYEIDGLKENCVDFLTRHTGSNNCVKIAIAADRVKAAPLLKHAVYQIYKAGRTEAEKSPFWNDILFGQYQHLLKELIHFGFKISSDDW